MYLATDKALKQPPLRSVNEICYRTLRHQQTGYARATTQQMLTKLYDNNDNISPQDLSENDARLKATYDVSQPIE